MVASSRQPVLYSQNSPVSIGGPTKLMLLSDFFTPKSAAKEIGMEYKALIQRVSRGKVKHERLGERLILIPRDEVRRLKEEKPKQRKKREPSVRTLFIQQHRYTYSCWRSMISRCRNPKNRAWSTHGGRGIKVCKRWKKFENFFADMGERPKGLTLERVDNDGDYKPGNCKWATWSEQNKNRRPWGSVSRGRPSC